MDITSAKYTSNDGVESLSIKLVADGVTMYVPLDPANTEYAEILRQISAGTLTIEEAD